MAPVEIVLAVTRPVVKQVKHVMKANRSVCLQLKNLTNVKLRDPTWFGTGGRIHDYMPYQINGKSSAVFGFHKTFWTFHGTEGVLVYQMECSPKKYLCIFYNNPIIGDNGFSLGFLRETTDASRELCTAMRTKAWYSTGKVQWHNTDESNKKEYQYRDTDFVANGYCSQGSPAFLFVKLMQK